LLPHPAHPSHLAPGYFSTTSQIKDKATPLQAILAKVDSISSLEIIEKLNYNVVVSGSDPKYRSVKLENPKIQRAVVQVPHAMEAMEEMGWKQLDGTLQLHSNVQMTMDTVRDVQTALVNLKRESAKIPSLK